MDGTPDSQVIAGLKNVLGALDIGREDHFLLEQRQGSRPVDHRVYVRQTLSDGVRFAHIAAYVLGDFTLEVLLDERCDIENPDRVTMGLQSKCQMKPEETRTSRNSYFHPSASCFSIRSLPMKGRSASGTTTLPSSCW